MLTWSGAVSAEIRASVDPNIVEEMESVRVTLRVEGGSQVEKLDLAALEENFEVLGTNTSSQFRSINGRVQSWVEYHINLRPKRTGDLQIPSLTIGGQRSPPLEITVRALEQDVKDAIERMVFFETEVSPNPVYVQSQTILTRRLYYVTTGVQIYSDLPEVPAIADAVVLPIGETATSTIERDGQRYGVYEQRYAIFPEKSGTLRIPEISVTSSVRLRTGGRTRRSGIRVSTEEVIVDVRPIPPGYPADQPWLTGKDVSITETWEPTDPRFEIGELVRRVLTVAVAGNTGSSIPPVVMQLPEQTFKQYPEPEQLSDDNAGAEILGSRKQIYSIIPITPGVITLPELRITWWDTINQRVRESVLPGRRVTVVGDPGVVQAPSTEQPPAVEPTPEQSDLPGDREPAYPLWLMGLTVVGFVGWLTTYLLTQRQPLAARETPVRRETPMYPGPKSVKAAPNTWRTLKSAAKGGDVGAMRAALVAHLSEHWRTEPTETVRRIEQSTDGQAIMTALNRALYSKEGGMEVTGKALLDTAASLSRSTPPKDSNDLPELYPSPG